MTWRKNLDKSIRPYIEKLIGESFNYKKSYTSAKDRGRAQLWVALAILAKYIGDLKLKLNYLEKTLQEVAGPKLKEKLGDKRKKEEKEVKKFIKELARGKISPKKKKEKYRKKVEKVKKKGKRKEKTSTIKIAKSL